MKNSAVYVKCDVTSFDDQVAVFELALSTYGSVDIVVSLSPVLDL